MTSFAWKFLALMVGTGAAILLVFWALFLSGWTVQ